MNKTRKLTQGAMFLAIVGAVMLIDRQLSFALTEIVVMAFSVVVVLYSAMYSFKDGFFLSLCLVVLIVLFGGVYSYIYGPISLIVGLAYSYMLNKGASTKTLLLTGIIAYVIGEFIATYAVYPLIGVSVSSQMSQVTEIASQAGFTEVLDTLGNLKDKIFIIAFVAAVIILGIMEGIITHFLSVALLKRFRIKDIPIKRLSEVKNNPVVAYGAMFLVFLSFFVGENTNETIVTVVTSLSLVGSCILIYYGYIYSVVAITMSLGRRGGFILGLAIILFVPLSLFVLMIMGFLYGTGPLYNKLQNRRNII